MSDSSDSGAGCLLIVGLFALAVGVGCIWGLGIGFLVFGAMLILIVALAQAVS